MQSRLKYANHAFGIGMVTVSHKGLAKKLMRSKYAVMLTDLEVSIQVSSSMGTLR